MGDESLRLQAGNFTLNSHQYSIPQETFFTDPGLKEMWEVTSLSYDPNTKRPFVASIEGKKYPFMATQFHPEKVTQAWNDNYGINHSWESMEINSFFGRQFVSMARSNKHYFGNFTETTPYLIDNY
jgi:gamma-glutamyl hydrolase